MTFYIACYINYIIPSDNWEQQLNDINGNKPENYIIPSDNWEQQQ